MLVLLLACAHPLPPPPLVAPTVVPPAPEPAVEPPAAPPPAPDAGWVRPAPGTVVAVDEAGLGLLAANPTGRVLVLNVWASWCAPCVEELPELGEVARAHPAAEVLLVNVDPLERLARHPAAAQAGLGSYFLDAEDAGLSLARTFPTWNEAIPFTVVVAADGRVVDRFFGRFERERLETAIRVAGGATDP